MVGWPSRLVSGTTARARSGRRRGGFSDMGALYSAPHRLESPASRRIDAGQVPLTWRSGKAGRKLAKTKKIQEAGMRWIIRVGLGLAVLVLMALGYSLMSAPASLFLAR